MNHKPLVLAAVIFVFGIDAMAQSPSSSDQTQRTNGPPNEESRLTEDLLELLDEDADDSPPRKSSKGNNGDGRPSAPSSSAEPATRIAEVGKLMDAAALLLKNGQSFQVAFETQSKIVDRLNALIDLFEHEPSKSRQSQRLSDDTTRQVAEQQTALSQSIENAKQQRDEFEEADSEPGSNGAMSSKASNRAIETETSSSAGDRLDRNDPTSLQNGVWGHLPERIRSRMQARMVEEFLPDYREQLEAYYRALLGRETRE